MKYTKNLQPHNHSLNLSVRRHKTNNCDRFVLWSMNVGHQQTGSQIEDPRNNKKKEKRKEKRKKKNEK